jgi:hypothetical protein
VERGGKGSKDKRKGKKGRSKILKGKKNEQ